MSKRSSPDQKAAAAVEECPPTRCPSGDLTPSSAPPTVSCVPADTDASAPDLPGQIGRYRILRLLGRGGMGAVYLAHDSQLERSVAVKVPLLDPRNGEALERFYREARTAGRLQHPNICPVFDVGQADGVHYLSMAYIEGEPLSAQVAGYARRPTQEAAALVRTIALALDEAHRQGVIHRDLKPANVMMNRRREPVVMDFGLAREVRAAAAQQTNQGTVMGTPAYMAPEQARGDVTAMGPGCDVYSLGVVLYELLVGRLPFNGPTMDVLVQQVRDDPAPPSQLRPGLDRHIEAICLKAMAKEPSRRFLSMAEFAQALADYLDGVATPEVERSLAEADPFEAAVAEALILLRTWGWETGIKRIEARFGDPTATADPRLALLLRWLQGCGDGRAEALEQFREVRQLPALAGWALLGEASIYNRNHNFGRAEAALREAAGRGDRRDYILQASIAHQRGFWLYQEGRLDQALAALHEALGLCGRDHFLTAEVLGTLGLVYANRNNFHAAREFFEQALRGKQRFGAERAAASSLRQLGTLYLEWGFPGKAQDAFEQSLRIVLARQDKRGQANSFLCLGRTALAQGLREAGGGHRAPARKHLARAAEWLDAAIRMGASGGWPTLEGLAHRDRARVYLAEGILAQAAEQARQAETLLAEAGHEEGLALVRQTQGILCRAQGACGESERLLRSTLAHFDATAAYLEAAQTQLELARTLAAAGALPQLVAAAFLEALRRAETCRRTDLVRAVEEELQGADEEAHWQHIFQRARGRAATVDTSSLTDGASEVATVLFLNLERFVPFCHGMEPQVVMQTLNQMLADLGAVLVRYEAHVTAYLGGGFMALVRGPDHAARAAEAALDLIAVMEEFNHPRAVLGLPQLPVRIGVGTGTVSIGNIGTYQKMDFTAVGNAVNLAARLVHRADNRRPCLSRETHEMLADRFAFAPGNPRILDLPGLGKREAWDLVGRKTNAPCPPT